MWGGHDSSHIIVVTPMVSAEGFLKQTLKLLFGPFDVKTVSCFQKRFTEINKKNLQETGDAVCFFIQWMCVISRLLI